MPIVPMKDNSRGKSIKEAKMKITLKSWIKWDDGQWWKRDTWLYFPHEGWESISWSGVIFVVIGFYVYGRRYLKRDWKDYCERQRAFKAGEIVTPNFDYSQCSKGIIGG